MVSQDRIKISFEKRNPLVFSISNILKRNKSLFSVNEFEEFEIKVDVSSNTRIFIQDPNGDMEEILDSYVVESGKYVPGYALIQINRNGLIFNKFFEVEPPKLLGKDGLIHIRRVIESISPGLSIDLKGTFLNNIVAGDMIENITKVKCSYLFSKYNSIIFSLNQIVKNPLLNLEKELVKEKLLKKQNSKTILKNIENSEKNIVYNIKTKEKYNSNENSALYFLLLNIKRHIMSICNSIHVSQIDINEKISEYSNQTQNRKHYNSLIDSYQKLKDKNQEVLLIMEEIATKINSTIEELNLRKLSTTRNTITPRFLKNKHYSNILTIYKILNADNVSFIIDINNHSQTINYKSTPTLFELYTYSIVKDILINKGYNSFTNNEDELSFTSLFVKENKKIELLFGTNIPFVDKINDYYGLISINSSKTTPDLVINTYDENNKIISSSIIEVKCRWFRNIYNESTPTDVLKQLRDYYQFRFKEKDEYNINRRFSIDNMICVFPFDNQNDYLYDEHEQIHYIALDLNKNFRDLDGYKKIEEILNV